MTTTTKLAEEIIEALRDIADNFDGIHPANMGQAIRTICGKLNPIWTERDAWRDLAIAGEAERRADSCAKLDAARSDIDTARAKLRALGLDPAAGKPLEKPNA